VAHAVGNNVGRFGYHQFARAGDAAGGAEFRIIRQEVFDTVEDVQGDALCGGRPISPTSVQRYLQGKFGDSLTPARAAMRRPARSVPPKTLAANGYALYVKFRPGVPTGVKGWGAKGKLDLTLIRRLTKPRRSRH
jgi:hypothetical protein